MDYQTSKRMSSKSQDKLQALNIADYFTLAMDEEIRNDGLPGSLCAVVLEFSQKPDIETLELRINEFVHCFPVALASLQQRGNRFYWCKRELPPQVFFQHLSATENSSHEFQQQIIDQVINQKQARETSTPIEFHLLTEPADYTLIIRWIHPFCDARGIDLIMRYVATENPTDRQHFLQPDTKALVNVQLDKYHWWQKISLLLKGKSYINRLDKLQSIQPFTSEQTPERLNYLIQKLSITETEQVLKKSRELVGLTGTSLYYIGCMMRALDKLNAEKEGQAYCVPYAFNLRKQRALSPVINNHVCALFAQVPREIINDRKQFFSYLKQQHATAIRQKLDYAFLPLMWAGSWLSLDKYGDILRLSSSGKERSSFWFSDVGRLDAPANDFLGAEIKSLFHLCQVTTPPALAFLCCIYQNQLILSYNFVEPQCDKVQIAQLQQLVLAELLAD